MIYGVLMVLVVYFLPEGIVPAVRRLVARPPQRLHASAAPPAAEAAPMSDGAAAELTSKA